MPVAKAPSSQNLQRETLRKIQKSKQHSAIQKELAALKIAYSEDSKLLTGYINKLIGVERIHPRFLPTQTSGRTSTIDPPITNWPRQCINQDCQQRMHLLYPDTISYIEHEWTDICWSVRDILLCDTDEVLVVHDHDNIEGRIHDLIVNDTVALQAHTEGYDLHTITCCDIFRMEYPQDRRNPHVSVLDAAWRAKYNWQGKDTRQRVLAKNFNHGSKYTETYKFVHKIKDIEQYGISYKELERLAKQYIVSKGDAWQAKLDIMARIRKDRESRDLYGFKRQFFDGSAETGREGFSHMISATVAYFNNQTLNMLEGEYGADQHCMHNAHDGDKVAFKKAMLVERYGEEWLPPFKADLSRIIERDIEYQGRSVKLTAGIKVYV